MTGAGAGGSLTSTALEANRTDSTTTGAAFAAEVVPRGGMLCTEGLGEDAALPLPWT